MKYILLTKKYYKNFTYLIEINTWLSLFRGHVVISYIGPYKFFILCKLIVLVFNIGLELKDGCLPVLFSQCWSFLFLSFFNITVLLQLLRIAKRGNKSSANPKKLIYMIL